MIALVVCVCVYVLDRDTEINVSCTTLLWTLQLEILATYTLFGNVQSMAATRLRHTERDTLLLTFLDAKLSVVEYDLSNHDLKTVSLSECR